jgi:prefoldin subunit 5
MAAKPSVPASERIAQSFKELAVSAAQLNAASDELARAIAPIDAALKKLNIGVAVWHQYFSEQDGRNGNYWGRSIGYTKIGSRWGLALSEASGNVQYAPDDDSEEWLYNDAPRWMRIEAVDHVPALLEALVKQVNKTATDLTKKSEQANELAQTIAALAADEQGRR